MKFSLIIPAKNEEKRILLPLLEYYHALYKEFGPKQFEIIVVINNTTDNTKKIVKLIKSVIATSKNIRIQRMKNAKGKGDAILFGFNKSKGEYIGFTDADGSVSPTSIIQLYKQLEMEPQKEAIFGSRYMKGAKILKRQSLTRRIISRAFNFVIRLVFFLPSEDTQCGIKIFRKDTAIELESNIKAKKWLFDLNVYLALRGKYLENPINWENREDSKLNFFNSVYPILTELLALMYLNTKLFTNRYFVKNK